MMRSGCFVVLLAFTGLLSAETRGQQASAQSVEGGALLKISCDPNILPIDQNTIGGLLRTTGLARKSVETVLRLPVTESSADSPDTLTLILGKGETPAEVEFHFVVQDAGRLGDERTTFVCNLEVAIRNSDRATHADVQKIVEETANLLRHTFGRLRSEELDQMQATRAHAGAALLRAGKKLAQIHAELRALSEKADRADLSRESILGELRDLQNQSRTLEMELQARQARRGAIEKAIAEIGQRAAGDEQNRMIERELEKIMNLRQSELDRLALLAKKELASSGDLGQAQEALAIAHVQLAQHRRDAARAANGDLLQSLNAELVQLSIDAVERETLLALTRQSLEAMKSGNLLELSDAYDRLMTVELPLAQHTLERAMGRSDDLNHFEQMARSPSVTIISGGD